MSLFVSDHITPHPPAFICAELEQFIKQNVNHVNFTHSSVSYLIVNEMPLGFRLLVVQMKHHFHSQGLLYLENVIIFDLILSTMHFTLIKKPAPNVEKQNETLFKQLSAVKNAVFHYSTVCRAHQ